jgi:F-type H+-transporting ATPase subunit delta
MAKATDLVERYAEGLLEMAEAEGVADRVTDELYRFGRALERNGELREVLGDRQLPVERRLAVVDELLETKADRQTIAAVAHIIQSGRGRLLVDIIEALNRAAAARRDRAVAEVRTAIELTDEQRSRLRDALGRATGRDLELQVVVDRDVVGGVLATIGDTVIDGTVSRQLSRMRSTLAGA